MSRISTSRQRGIFPPVGYRSPRACTSVSSMKSQLHKECDSRIRVNEAGPHTPWTIQDRARLPNYADRPDPAPRERPIDTYRPRQMRRVRGAVAGGAAGKTRPWRSPCVGSAGRMPGVAGLPGARVYEKCMEGVSGAGGGWTGRAMPVVIKHPSCARRSGWGRRRVVVPGTLIPVAEVLLPAVLGAVRACTWLSVDLAAGKPWRTYIWCTACLLKAPSGIVCSGQRLCGGAGRSGL
jgi:hypothetical protein